MAWTQGQGGGRQITTLEVSLARVTLSQGHWELFTGSGVVESGLHSQKSPGCRVQCWRQEGAHAPRRNPGSLGG